MDRHLQSNNNQHAAAETPPPVLAKSDHDASSPAAGISASASGSAAASAVAGASASASASSSSSPSAGANCGSKSVATQQDVDEVARLFEEKPEAFEKWLTERAPPEALSRLHEFIESRKPHKRPSVTSDLFQQWMASPTVQQVGRGRVVRLKAAAYSQRVSRNLPVPSNITLRKTHLVMAMIALKFLSSCSLNTSPNPVNIATQFCGTNPANCSPLAFTSPV